MKTSPSRQWRACVIAAGFVALSASATFAQQPPAPSPAAIGYAKEILAMKGTQSMYAGAVPGSVQRIKTTLLQSNPNMQKDLDEVAVIVAQQLNGREKEVGELMAKVYASDFSEQELKDLVAFYKSPLGQKLLTQEPRAVQGTMAVVAQWGQAFFEEVDKAFRTEMRKRGKPL